MNEKNVGRLDGIKPGQPPASLLILPSSWLCWSWCYPVHLPLKVTGHSWRDYTDLDQLVQNLWTSSLAPLLAA